jgi:LuxR family transcriptional regulator
MQRMMNETAKVGLKDGYVFPVHCDRGLIGYLSIGGPVMELSSLQIALLDAVARKAFWMLLRVSAPEIAAELTTPVNVQLTRREMEALGYLADGMTSNEISHVLNISSNTVDWYMNGIQSKLKAKNRHHAVAIAFRSGLIS